MWVEPVTGVPVSGGAPTFVQPIPAQAAFGGQVITAQALSFDAQTASGLGAVSNGVILWIH